MRDKNWTKFGEEVVEKGLHREDTRNYLKEAQNMIKPLTKTAMYELYEIVLNRKQQRCSDERMLELNAVQTAIERNPYADVSVLFKLRQGYGSMAESAHKSDMIQSGKKKRKKV